MHDVKHVSTPLASYFRLSKVHSPTAKEERTYMEKTHYVSAIGSLMYAMVCTRPDITYIVGVVSNYIGNLGRQYWEAIKWILITCGVLRVWHCISMGVNKDYMVILIWVMMLIAVEALQGMSLLCMVL